MKFINYILLSLSLLLSYTSYAQKNNSSQNQKIVIADFFEQKIKANLICIASHSSTEVSTAEQIMNINNSLLEMEKEPKLLYINLMMPNKPLQGDLFVFGIELEDSKKLTIEMLDQKDFSMVANCTFIIKEGGSFLAVDVKNLKNGTYNFRIKDTDGQELNRLLSISKVRN